MSDTPVDLKKLRYLLARAEAVLNTTVAVSEDVHFELVEDLVASIAELDALDPSIMWNGNEYPNWDEVLGDVEIRLEQFLEQDGLASVTKGDERRRLQVTASYSTRNEK